jgi:HEPN domain-containing protein
MDAKISYWLDLADYDLETAEAMLKTGRYLYVGFMCHQVVEKGLKAVIASTGQEPPYIHNLSRLGEKAGLYQRMSPDQRDFVDSLEPLNIQGRYPGDVDKLSVLMTAARCRKVIVDTKDLYEWIKATL